MAFVANLITTNSSAVLAQSPEVSLRLGTMRLILYKSEVNVALRFTSRLDPGQEITQGKIRVSGCLSLYSPPTNHHRASKIRACYFVGWQRGTYGRLKVIPK